MAFINNDWSKARISQPKANIENETCGGNHATSGLRGPVHDALLIKFPEGGEGTMASEDMLAIQGRHNNFLEGFGNLEGSPETTQGQFYRGLPISRKNGNVYLRRGPPGFEHCGEGIE